MTGRSYANLLGAALIAGLAATVLAQSPDEGDIGGVVQSAAGPEAGVWVIAETDDLDTRLRKIVVTDDDGRFLLPDLPAASYQVWVRGYGLVDSTPVTGQPGQTLALHAVQARSPQEAAQVYPPNYWYSLLEPPPADQFPGTGPDGNGIAAGLESQAAWVDITKQGCQLCHQMGNRFTFDTSHLTNFDSTVEGWDHRVTFGQRGSQMSAVMNRFGRDQGLAMFADWSDRIAAGEVPEAPPRPQGVERNVVLTMWEWGSETAVYARRDHDRQAESAGQRRRARVRRLDHHRQAGDHRCGSPLVDRARRAAARSEGDGPIDVPDRARVRAVTSLG